MNIITFLIYKWLLPGRFILRALSIPPLIAEQKEIWVWNIIWKALPNCPPAHWVHVDEVGWPQASLTVLLRHAVLSFQSLKHSSLLGPAVKCIAIFTCFWVLLWIKLYKLRSGPSMHHFPATQPCRKSPLLQGHMQALLTLKMCLSSHIHLFTHVTSYFNQRRADKHPKYRFLVLVWTP